jgi:hypothetical protein
LKIESPFINSTSIEPTPTSFAKATRPEILNPVGVGVGIDVGSGLGVGSGSGVGVGVGVGVTAGSVVAMTTFEYNE